ncbi:unnamed protein product [Prorocentrum cordatum]|uniref:Uncharacterized protein n=1 Tax=Prorocentrum cordatum TaxID=2364126 RepID=A0ABN9VUF7_9DINO|nr:unnamed protein product [Polarella glacialis]
MMARGAAAGNCPWRSSRDRRLARRRARDACERGLWRALRGRGDPPCRGTALVSLAEDVDRRERLSRGVIVSRILGSRTAHGDVLIRNCSQHARDLPADGAGAAQWRAAARGPRLGAGSSPAAGVPEFLPSAGRWEALHDDRLPAPVAQVSCAFEDVVDSTFPVQEEEMGPVDASERGSAHAGCALGGSVSAAAPSALRADAPEFSPVVQEQIPCFEEANYTLAERSAYPVVDSPFPRCTCGATVFSGIPAAALPPFVSRCVEGWPRHGRDGIAGGPGSPSVGATFSSVHGDSSMCCSSSSSSLTTVQSGERFSDVLLLELCYRGRKAAPWWIARMVVFEAWLDPLLNPPEQALTPALEVSESADDFSDLTWR